MSSASSPPPLPFPNIKTQTATLLLVMAIIDWPLTPRCDGVELKRGKGFMVLGLEVSVMPFSFLKTGYPHSSIIMAQ
jgi:hypothetical protein